MEPLGKKFRGAFGGVGPGVLSSGLWGCSHRVLAQTGSWIRVIYTFLVIVECTPKPL